MSASASQQSDCSDGSPVASRTPYHHDLMAAAPTPPDDQDFSTRDSQEKRNALVPAADPCTITTPTTQRLTSRPHQSQPGEEQQERTTVSSLSPVRSPPKRASRRKTASPRRSPAEGRGLDFLKPLRRCLLLEDDFTDELPCGGKPDHHQVPNLSTEDEEQGGGGRGGDKKRSRK